MSAWNLSRQSTMNCLSADNLTINSFVTYKRSELCEVRLRFCSTSKRTPQERRFRFRDVSYHHRRNHCIVQLQMRHPPQPMGCQEQLGFGKECRGIGDQPLLG